MTPRRGLTLLETAIVLAITAIGALLVLPLWPSALRDPEPDGTPGSLLTLALRDARQHAVRERQDVVVYLDVRQQQLRMDTIGTSGRGVWREEALPLAANELLVTRDTAAVVRFRASGAAQGAPLSLRHASGWLSIELDPWSGEVTRVVRQ